MSVTAMPRAWKRGAMTTTVRTAATAVLAESDIRCAPMTAATIGNGLTIEYQEQGEGQPLLLVMGFGAQLIAWPQEFVDLLVAEGFRVIRHDNRDIGLSSLIDAPAPTTRQLILSTVAPRFVKAAYTVDDMADDAAGLLEHLGVGPTHIVGASMGGMIAQAMAIRHPGRVASLTSIMSNTGDRKHGRIKKSLLRKLPKAIARRPEDAVDKGVAGFRLTAGSHFDEATVRQMLQESFDRSYRPDGSGRQGLAIAASKDRTWDLGRVRVPTLVIHGLADPLVQPSGGIATARAVPGAKLVMYPDMGHDLPRPAVGRHRRRDRRERPAGLMDQRPTMVTLDVEGVLVPEIWIAVAERTGIDELRRTTRDEPDYDVLMRYRLDLLARHGLGLAAITAVIGELAPLPGAVEFLDDAARPHARRAPVGHVRRVRRAAHGPARAADDPVPQPRRRRRPHRRLPPADGGPEAPRRRGLPCPRVPRAGERRLLQRRVDAPRRRCRVPVPGAGTGASSSSRSCPPSSATTSWPPPSPGEHAYGARCGRTARPRRRALPGGCERIVRRADVAITLVTGEGPWWNRTCSIGDGPSSVSARAPTPNRSSPRRSARPGVAARTSSPSGSPTSPCATTPSASAGPIHRSDASLPTSSPSSPTPGARPG